MAEEDHAVSAARQFLAQATPVRFSSRVKNVRAVLNHSLDHGGELMVTHPPEDTINIGPVCRKPWHAENPVVKEVEHQKMQLARLQSWQSESIYSEMPVRFDISGKQLIKFSVREKNILKK